METPKPINAANSADFRTVAIFFQDAGINELFSALLQSRGERTQVIHSTNELSDISLLITEPQLFEQLPQSYNGKCMLVGNKNALKGLNAICLTRPLTEEKIESAIVQLLSR